MEKNAKLMLQNFLDNLKNKGNNIVDECPEGVFDSRSYKNQVRKYKGEEYNVYEHLDTDYALSIVLSPKQQESGSGIDIVSIGKNPYGTPNLSTEEMEKEFHESDGKPLEPTRRNLIKYWNNYFANETNETNKTGKKHVNALIQLDRYNIRAKSSSNNTKFSNSLVEKLLENRGKNTNLAVIKHFVELGDYVTLAWGKRPEETKEFDDEICKKLNEINFALRKKIIDNNEYIYKIKTNLYKYPVHPSIPMVAYEPSITNVDENDIEEIFKESEF